MLTYKKEALRKTKALQLDGQRTNSAPPAAEYLLQEDGDFLLLESGGKIQLDTLPS